VNADDKPVKGAMVSDHFLERLDVKNSKPGVQFREPKKTGADGTTSEKYSVFSLTLRPARDFCRKRLV